LCLNNIGGAYLAKGDADNALTYLQQALQLRQKLNVSGDIADTLATLGEVYTTTGQFNEALTSSMQALDLYRKAGNAHGAAEESHQMGLIFEYQGRIGAAVNAMQDAVNGYRKLGDRSAEMVDFLNDLADAQAQAGRGADSPPLLQEAQGLARSLKSERAQAELLNTQGDIQRYRGDLQAAQDSYSQALRAGTRATDQDQVLLSKLHLAEVGVAQGHAQSALRDLRNVTQQADARNLKYLSLLSSVDMAEAMIDSKDYSHAGQELQADLGKGEKLGARYQTVRIHYLLGNTSRLSGNSAEAAGHYRQALSLLDEIRKEPGAEKFPERSDVKLMATQASQFATTNP
jgi:tetratricopeptide (TPR) repeat protein